MSEKFNLWQYDNTLEEVGRDSNNCKNNLRECREDKWWLVVL